MESSKKVLIGCPCYSGRMVVETVASLVDAIEYHARVAPEDQATLRFRVRNFTTYAAEKLCEEAVGSYDYLLFWGDDMIAPADVISRLIAHDKDIVAGSFFARSDPYPYYAFDENGEHFGLDRLNSGLQQVSAAGTGVMLIKTDVLKKMKRPWWFWPNDDSTDCDKEFCHRAVKEAGAEIWVDTDMVIPHLDFTPNAITDKTHLRWLKSIMASGVLERPEVKSHPTYKKMEAIIHGSKRVLES